MKGLKIWSWILRVCAITCYLVGVFSGEFNEYMGLYGDSPLAIALLLLTGFCLLLSITADLVRAALREKDHA